MITIINNNGYEKIIKRDGRNIIEHFYGSLLMADTSLADSSPQNKEIKKPRKSRRIFEQPQE
jgi:hypothetical protein